LKVIFELAAPRLLDCRPLSLDRQPHLCIATDFNRDNAPMHDEGSSIVLVVYRSAFERLSIRESLAETIQYLFVGGRSLQDARDFPDHFLR
jgi:hypothetical protein